MLADSVLVRRRRSAGRDTAAGWTSRAADSTSSFLKRLSHLQAFGPFVLLVGTLLVACKSPVDAGASREGTASSCALPPRAALPEPVKQATNIDGAPLAVCSTSPLTGVYRDGRCATGPDDVGVHVVCAKVTREFLEFSKSRGNDLVSPRGEFAGLHAGDRWCLCASRWAEAEPAGVAPPVVLDATEAAAARTIPRATLKAHAETTLP